MEYQHSSKPDALADIFMQKTLLTIIASTILFVTQAQIFPTRTKFLKKLDSCNLRLVVSDSFNVYKELLIDTTVSTKYDYSLFDSVANIEIRYIVIPLTNTQSSNQDTIKHFFAGQDIMYRGILTTLYLSISQDNSSIKKYQAYEQAAVKNDFNADGGGICALKPSANFGRGFKNILAISYYKKYKAIVVVLYLLNDIDKNLFPQLLSNTYKVVKFKD